MESTYFQDKGSFRDPKGSVYIAGDKVYRTVMPAGVEDYEFVRDTGLYSALVDKALVIEAKEVELNALAGGQLGAHYLLEHPKLAFLSYPYEWSFKALKSAALLHLEIQLEALEYGVKLSDASAYNIQFIGCKPVFIDSLSFSQYRDGEFWNGHNQFCEQFLNPLLLRSILGITHHGWYRGNQEGIPTQDLARIMPFKNKLSWNVFTQVTLQAALQNAAQIKRKPVAGEVKNRKFPKSSYRNMLLSLHKWITKLTPLDKQPSTWGNYETDNSYSSDGAVIKKDFVSEFISTVKPRQLWDIGCNTGHYAAVALGSGAGSVIGFDFDPMALDQGFDRACDKNLNFTPCYMDASNQSPDQGWNGAERMGIAKRSSADALINLAFAHHMIISKNIPMEQYVNWILGFADQGIVEFVPKSDPMVQDLLLLREDIFPDYEQDTFIALISQQAEIVKTAQVTGSGRVLVWYKKSGLSC